jgi:hypothetical protein
METESALSRMFTNVWPHLGERERRLVAASEARRIGRKGISMVSRACGLSRVTITKGIKELDEAPLAPGKVRRSGAGRPRVERVDPGIRGSLEALIREDSGLDPPILWTLKSTRRLAVELTAAQHRISHEKVAQILRQGGYSLQGTRRNDDSGLRPDRKGQFQRINERVAARLGEGQPVISIESRRRESAALGEGPAAGALAPGDPLAAGERPIGLYDMALGRDRANVETALDPAAFALDSILGWWLVEGRDLFPGAEAMLIAVDGSGGASRGIDWPARARRLASATGLSVELCRLPPGTTKWNVPNRRLFSFLSSHWLGEAERDHEVTARIANPPEEARTMALGLRLDHSRFGPARREAEEPGSLGGWHLLAEPEAAPARRPALEIMRPSMAM